MANIKIHDLWSVRTRRSGGELVAELVVYDSTKLFSAFMTSNSLSADACIKLASQLLDAALNLRADAKAHCVKFTGGVTKKPARKRAPKKKPLKMPLKKAFEKA